MTGIQAAFQRLQETGEAALIGYLTLGDPDLKTSIDNLEALAGNVDILEIGLPFSDPIADGPTIQAAMERALNSGITTEDAFEAAIELRKRGIRIPFVFMTYYNIVLQYGPERFLKECSDSGVQGVLVSDLPLEESGDFEDLCQEYDVDPIFLLAPTTGEERAHDIIKHGKGFLYLVSLLGVTGARKNVEDRTLAFVREMVKLKEGVPLVVGFGVSRREHVQRLVAAGADGVVVGSAFVRLVERHKSDSVDHLRALSRELKTGTISKEL